MPRSFANYLTVTNGQPFLGRLRVLAPPPAPVQFPRVPMVDWTQFGQFVNGVQTREENTIRPQLIVSGSQASSNLTPGDNGWWIQFFDPNFPPDSFGFSRGMFARDLTGSAVHGPGFLASVFYQSAWGWGTPDTS